MLLIRAHCASAERCLSSSLVIIRDTANVTVKGRLVSLIPFSKKTKRAETGKFARVLMERAHFRMSARRTLCAKPSLRAASAQHSCIAHLASELESRVQSSAAS